jgi:hypothetical protein
MTDQVFAWIKGVALLNDESLKEEINLIHQSSLKAFARALSKIQRPTETLTLQDGILEQHPHAETINLLKSIGEHTIAAINANVPVSPVPYDVSPHMDLNTRIKVLTRRTTIHLSEIPRGKGCSPTHLQIRQFIGQDLSGLELCFETQQAFNAYTLQHFKWNSSMCCIYIAYYRFLVDIPSLSIRDCLGQKFAMIVSNGEDGWMLMLRKCVQQVTTLPALFGREHCQHIVKQLAD